MGIVSSAPRLIGGGGVTSDDGGLVLGAPERLGEAGEGLLLRLKERLRLFSLTAEGTGAKGRARVRGPGSGLGSCSRGNWG